MNEGLQCLILFFCQVGGHIQRLIHARFYTERPFWLSLFKWRETPQNRSCSLHSGVSQETDVRFPQVTAKGKH